MAVTHTPVRIETDGNFTIPAEVRQRLGIKEGDVVIVTETPDGMLVAPRIVAVERALDELGEAIREAGVTLEPSTDASGNETTTTTSSTATTNSVVRGPTSRQFPPVGRTIPSIRYASNPPDPGLARAFPHRMHDNCSDLPSLSARPRSGQGAPP
ncbi:MAG: AbrB/MazE/SpoVT family DNA-binding domain-containing protein [Thermomicrobiales bacterium]